MTFCMKNGMIHDMVNPGTCQGDILVEEGKIVDIGKGIEIVLLGQR